VVLVDHHEFDHPHEHERQPGGDGMKDLLNRNRKAIVGLLTPPVAFVAAKAGLHLTDGEAASAAGALTGALVWLIANLRSSYGTG
jgi:hypothetical protein